MTAPETCPNPDLHDWTPPPLTLAFTGIGDMTWMYSPRHLSMNGETTARTAFDSCSVAERGALLAICREIIAEFGEPK